MKAIIGWMLASMGLIFYAVELDNIITGVSTQPVLSFVLGSIFFGAGGSLIVAARRARKLEEPPTPKLAPVSSVDTVVLQVAKQAGGEITAAQVAADTPLSYAESAEILESLVKVGACYLSVSEKGVRVYTFPEFGAGGAGETFID